MRELYTPPTVGSTFKWIKNQQHETKYAILIARTNKTKGVIGGWLYLRHSLASCLFLCLSVTLELAYITLLITRLMFRPAKKKSVDSVTHYLKAFVWSGCLFTQFHSIQGFLYLDYLGWSGRSGCGGSRTHTLRILSPLPLPLGYASVVLVLTIWPVIVYLFVFMWRFLSVS